MSGDTRLRVVTVGGWPIDVLVAACDRARAVVVGCLGARAAGLDPTSRWPSATELIVKAHPDRVLATGPHAIDAAVTALEVYRVPVFLLEPPTVHEARRLGGLALAGGAHSALFDPLSEQLRGAFDILRAGGMGRLRRVVLECGPAGDPDAGTSFGLRSTACYWRSSHCSTRWTGGVSGGLSRLPRRTPGCLSTSAGCPMR